MGLFDRLRYYLEECLPFRKSSIELLLEKMERDTATPDADLRYDRNILHF